jgi:hypothetical protein
VSKWATSQSWVAMPPHTSREVSRHSPSFSPMLPLAWTPRAAALLLNRSVPSRRPRAHLSSLTSTRYSNLGRWLHSIRRAAPLCSRTGLLRKRQGAAESGLAGGVGGRGRTKISGLPLGLLDTRAALLRHGRRREAERGHQARTPISRATRTGLHRIYTRSAGVADLRLYLRRYKTLRCWPPHIRHKCTVHGDGDTPPVKDISMQGVWGTLVEMEPQDHLGYSNDYWPDVSGRGLGKARTRLIGDVKFKDPLSSNVEDIGRRGAFVSLASATPRPARGVAGGRLRPRAAASRALLRCRRG